MSKQIAINKLVFTLFIVCVVLLTSVFIVHHQSAPQKSFSSDNVFLFQIPRKLNRFELVTHENKKFTVNDLKNHWTLMFFGFTHCQKVCPTTITLLNQVYKDLHILYPNLQVVLVTIDPDRDTPKAVQHYAASFNERFIGVSGKIAEIRKLQAQLGIFSTQDNSSDDNYQMQHTTSILLINPQGEWAGIFKYGMKAEDFTQSFKMAAG